MVTTDLFTRWFIKQFGERPKIIGKTEFDLIDDIELGKKAQLILTSQKNWDEKFDSCLKTWWLRDVSLDEIEKCLK